MKKVLLLIATLSVTLMIGCSGDNSKKGGAPAGDVNTAEYPNVDGQAFGRWKNQDLTAFISKDKITLKKECGASVTSSVKVTENSIEFLEKKEAKVNDQCEMSVNPGTIRYYMMNYNNKEMLVVSGDNGDLAFERIP